MPPSMQAANWWHSNTKPSRVRCGEMRCGACGATQVVMVGLALLILIIAAAVFAPLITHYDPIEIVASERLQPPSAPTGLVQIPLATTFTHGLSTGHRFRCASASSRLPSLRCWG